MAKVKGRERGQTDRNKKNHIYGNYFSYSLKTGLVRRILFFMHAVFIIIIILNFQGIFSLEYLF